MSVQAPLKKYFKTVKMLKSKPEIETEVIEVLCDSDEEVEDSLINVTNIKRKKLSDSEPQSVNYTIKKQVINTNITLVKDVICINKANKEFCTVKNNISNRENHFDNKLLNSLRIQKSETENNQQSDIIDSISEIGSFHIPDLKLSEVNNISDENQMQHNYQTLFLLEIINSVFCNDNNKLLFTADENKQILDFINLSHEAKNFCARLFFRKNSWYRMLDFIKSIQLDIYEKDAVVLTESLRNKGFVLTDYSKEDPKVMLNLFNLSEIKQLHSKYKLSKTSNMNKNGMIESILKNVKQQTTLSFSKSSVSIFHKNIEDILKTCVQLSIFTKKLFLKLLLLYSLTNTMLKLPNDLYRLFWDIKTKKIKFPVYVIDQPKIFINIDHFNRFQIAYNLRRRLDEAITLKDINEGVCNVLKAYQILCDVLVNQDYEQEYLHLPKFLHRFTTGYNLVSVVSTGIDILKTEASGKHSIVENKILTEKKDIIRNLFNSNCLTYMHVCEILSTLVNQNIYLKSKKGLWYGQLSLIYHTHLHNIQQSAHMIIMGLETEALSEVYQLKFSNQAERLLKPTSKLSDELKTKLNEKIIPPKKQKNIVITASAVPETLPGHKRIYVQNELDGKTYAGVEQIAINHYISKEGYEQGIHFEGTTVVSLFGLLFWDIIYEYYVPNAFITPIQETPLDLFSSEFYQNRKIIIDDRVNQLINNSDIDSVCQIINNNIVLHSEELSIVNKNLCSKPEMLNTIVKCMGIKILARICERLSKSYGLSRAGFPDLLVWSPNKNICKFVEVKGQNDKLSEKQILWIEFLTNIGADVEVCHVHTKGTKKSKKVFSLSS